MTQTAKGRTRVQVMLHYAQPSVRSTYNTSKDSQYQIFQHILGGGSASPALLHHTLELECVRSVMFIPEGTQISKSRSTKIPNSLNEYVPILRRQ